jgi:hypothetical protein
LKYIFWINRASGLDHLAPVVYSLTKYSSVKIKDIIVLELFPSHSLINFDQDNRILFLKSLNISVNLLKIKRFRTLFLFSTSDSKNFILKVIKKLIRVIIYKIFFKRYKEQIINIANKYKNRGIFITDDGSSEIYKFLTKTAQKNRILSIALPHSVELHYGRNKLEEHAANYPKSYHYDYYDIVVMPNEISNSYHNIPKSKLKILGSARFCEEWVKQLCSIYPLPIELINKNKLNIIFLAEKNGPDDAPWIYKKHINRIIEYMDNHDSINLIIKFHPSLPINEAYIVNKSLVVKKDSDYVTNQLINSSDVVIATASGALTDAFVLGKTIIIPKYASPFNLVFDNYSPKCTVSNYEQFVERIEYLLKYGCTNNKYEDFYHDIVLGGNNNILHNYANYLSSNNFKNKGLIS